VLLLAAAALLLGGCGGGGGAHLNRTDVAPLIALAGRIAHEAPCAQARDIRALDRQRVALLNAGKVPRTLQEPFSSGVNALVAQTPPCLPAVPAAVAPPVAPVAPAGDGRRHGHGHGHGEHHGHGKGD
jgi:hypothetical protein